MNKWAVQTFDLLGNGNKLIPRLLIADDRAPLGPIGRANQGINELCHIKSMCEHDGAHRRSPGSLYLLLGCVADLSNVSRP